MWKPRDPDVFGQAVRPWSSSTSRATSATSTICRHGDPGHRIEVDAQFVGVIEVVGQHRMRVEVDAAQVDRPGQPAASWMTASFAEVPRRVRSSATSIQSGRFSGARFWNTASCVDALDEALEDHRAARHAAQRAVGDGEVVLGPGPAWSAGRRRRGRRPCPGG